MKSIGLYMAIAGVVSIFLHFMGMNMRLLMWIDLWGLTVGWVIRIGLVVLGLILMGLASKTEENELPAFAE